ncbi:MAG: hypothetical protein LBG45_12595 [Dysgonamonadaceae bacterium]|jgi:hypothetical protein|nr:hypothetical protein [Dysgonamonadaceae bacterium]
MKQLKKILVLTAILCPFVAFSQEKGGVIGGEKLDYFFDSSVKFDEKIPSPEQFLGYPTGSKITEHHRINAYFEKLASLSDRTRLIEIGRTHEDRPLLVLAVSSPENIAKLDDYRRERNKVRKAETPETPLILFLGYSVHGNEPSGAEASLLSAYYLVAAQTGQVKQQLSGGIFFIDPVRNPDGQERFAEWVNSNRSIRYINDSGLDREHTEGWPRGRGNHYWFDLNRDWVNIVHPESQSRVAFYQDWLPHVQVDHHEMGANSSFFFEPTDPDGNESRFVPKATYRLNAEFANYYARALDRIGSFYYTKEGYDNKNPTFGSTYPDYNGGAGILFEQGSSRGIRQESENGLLTFAHTVRNQLVASIATVEAATASRKALFDLQKEFFTVNPKNSGKNYIIGDAYDRSRLNRFINRLLDHRLEVYENNSDVTIDSVKYEKGKSYIIPVAQPNSALVQIIFDDKKDYNDVSKLGYGAGFSVAYSSGLACAQIANPAKGTRLEEKLKNRAAPFTKSDYAYLIDFRDSRTQAALFRILEKDVIVKTASRAFSINYSGQTVDFPVGTLLIPVGNQPLSSGELFTLLKSVGETEGINVLPVATGYNVKGVDLGSSAFRRIHKPTALLLTGGGVSSTEAGEIWHLFDQKLAYPIVRVEVESFNRIPLYNFNRIILAGGSYSELNAQAIEKLKQWTNNGGVLVTINSASQWASRNLLEPRAARRNDSIPPQPAAPAGRHGLPTSVIETRINLNSPLAYGLTRESLPVNKENLSVLKGNQGNTVATYPDSPLLNGYLPKESEPVFKNSASILTANNVILFAEDPVFRGVWDASERTFVNAVLFGDLIRPVFW